MFSLRESLTKELRKTKANEGRQQRRSCYLWMDSCWVDGCTLARVNIQSANKVASIYHLQVPNQDLPSQHRCNMRIRISWILDLGVRVCSSIKFINLPRLNQLHIWWEIPLEHWVSYGVARLWASYNPWNYPHLLTSSSSPYDLVILHLELIGFNGRKSDVEGPPLWHIWRKFAETDLQNWNCLHNDCWKAFFAKMMVEQLLLALTGPSRFHKPILDYVLTLLTWSCVFVNNK